MQSSISKIDNAADRVRRAIVDLQKPQPFFAHLLMRMRVSEMPKDYPMQSMGVNARGDLKYAEKFVMERTDAEMMGLLCHEVMHVALLHFLRTGSRNKQLSNIVQDAAVNSMVLRSGLSLPKGGIPVDIHNDRSSFKIQTSKKVTEIVLENVSKKSWEELYAESIEQLEMDENPLGGGDGPVGPGGFDHHEESDEGMSDEEKRQEEQRWREGLTEALQYAKQQGKLPGGMERIIDGLLKPKVTWKHYLARYVRPFVQPVDWSYSRPHRKSKALEVFLPNVVKEHIKIGLLGDVSGSIGDDEMKEWLTEAMAIASSFQSIELTVWFADTRITDEYKFDNNNKQKILAIKPHGGGGTSMENALNEIKAKNTDLPLVIVLTDGYDSYAATQRTYPFQVIWCISKNGITLDEAKERIKYGIKIKMD